MNLHDRPLIEQMAVAYAAEIERLQAENARLQEWLESQRLAAVKYEAECETLRTVNDELRAALEEIAKLDAHINPGVYIARAALAKEEGK